MVVVVVGASVGVIADVDTMVVIYVVIIIVASVMVDVVARVVVGSMVVVAEAVELLLMLFTRCGYYQRC